MLIPLSGAAHPFMPLPRHFVLGDACVAPRQPTVQVLEAPGRVSGKNVTSALPPSHGHVDMIELAFFCAFKYFNMSKRECMRHASLWLHVEQYRWAPQNKVLAVDHNYQAEIQDNYMCVFRPHRHHRYCCDCNYVRQVCTCRCREAFCPASWRHISSIRYSLAEDLEWDVQFKAKPYLDQACVNSPTNAVFESLQTHFRTRMETGYAVS